MWYNAVRHYTGPERSGVAIYAMPWAESTWYNAVRHYTGPERSGVAIYAMGGKHMV